MVLSELVSTLRELSRSDKFYNMQLLISELAQQETSLTQLDQTYPIWSPYSNAVEAADTTLQALYRSQSSTGCTSGN